MRSTCNKKGLITFAGLVVLACTVSACITLKAPSNKPPRGAARSAERLLRVDEDGVLRWQDNGEEVALFGVNYCLPSASAYRMVGRVGASHEKAVEQDVCHFARMGLNGLRLSFWGDWECSDRDGNLVDNEHLRLLDYLIYRAKAHGIYMLLTPIILYSPVWPEPEELNTQQGFSRFFPKAKMGIDPNAIKAQSNYLSQIMQHVNRYTGLAYKDEPAIVAVELVNEPWIPGPGARVKEYVNTLVKAVRDTGCTKPLFYNVSQDKQTSHAVGDSKVDGCTFGWYPTELINGWSLQGNFLPYVDDYPQMRDPNLAKKAKLIYEFDAADVAGSYMYPAMARTFRTGGVQFATMFTYDPLPIASTNIEYQTHYMNLVYTPNKAVSLMISAEAFRRLPRLKSYGKYPKSTSFGPFRVSYEQDLSEMVTDRELMYSNDTKSMPPKPELLERIVGCGSSPVVSYEGTGSYFLEKLKRGVWRLEVYPDAVLVNDPYGKHRIDREVCRILWREWPMEIHLPDLGSAFTVEPLNNGNTFSTKAEDGTFSIRPGVYFLKRKGAAVSTWKASTPFGQISLGQFIAPLEKEQPMVVLHKPPRQLVAGRVWTVAAQVVSSAQPEKVNLYIRRAGPADWPYFIKFFQHQMQRQKGYRYAVELPAEQVKAGLLEYCISVQTGGQVRTFPADVRGEPSDWDFPEARLWETLIVGKDAPVVLFDARRDRGQLLFSQTWQRVQHTRTIVPGMRTGGLALRVDVPSFKPEPQDVSCRYVFGKEIDSRREDISRCKALRLRVRAGQEATSRFEVALIEKDGSAWGTAVELTTQWREVSIPLSELVPIKVALLPWGWPEVLPYWKENTAVSSRPGSLRIKDIEAVQFSFGARLFPEHTDEPHAIEVESITLEISP